MTVTSFNLDVFKDNFWKLHAPTTDLVIILAGMDECTFHPRTNVKRVWTSSGRLLPEALAAAVDNNERLD